MDAIHIISVGNLTADSGKVITGAAVFRIHVSIGTYLSDESRKFLPEALASQRFPFAYRDGNHPGVELHAALVAFIDGKLQGIVARRLSRESREASIPRFVIGRIDHGATDAGLDEYGVDLCLLQAVENLTEFLLLLLGRVGRLGVGVRPVDSADGGEPYGSYLVLGRQTVVYDAGTRQYLLLSGILRACAGKILPKTLKCI